jgi:transcriptional regulator with XRE-family HTH domain
MLLMDSASLIRQARMRRGLSQAELAELSGRDRAQLARWERGVNVPSFENLRDLLHACGFDLSTELVEFDTAQDDDLLVGLRETPQERVAELLRRPGPSAVTDHADAFDPLRILGGLDQLRLNYVVVGELAEVVHGSRGMADLVEIAPGLRPDNLERLRRALRALGVSEKEIARVDDEKLAEHGARLRVESPAGTIVITPMPEGTRGWNDLRRAATREPLGGGLRPSIASLADLVRMNEAATEPGHADRARTLRRMVDLERGLGVDL